MSYLFIFRMNFPPGYPLTQPPTFQVSAAEMPAEKVIAIVEKLNSIAGGCLARGGKKAVQPCLRYLVQLIHQRRAHLQKLSEKEGEVSRATVSYTHLTLPTIYSV